MFRVIAFDVYGTLFDITSLCDHVSTIIGIRDPGAFVSIWRSKQLEYTLLLSLMGRFDDFRSVTMRSLKYVMKQYGLGDREDLLESLLDGWLNLRPYRDTLEAIPRIAERYLVVALTNGTREMVEELLRRSGLEKHFREIISASDVRIYKPSPFVYRAIERMGVKAGETLMVSSNPWDVAGAINAGLQACYVNRREAPMEELDLKPHIVVKNLSQLAEILAGLS